MTPHFMHMVKLLVACSPYVLQVIFARTRYPDLALESADSDQ